MIRHAILAAALLMSAPVLAQEPAGCDKFKWPLERERALLATAAPAASGSEIAQTRSGAFNVSLLPLVDAKLPYAPTRAPKGDAFAGYLTIASPPQPGTYRITLSQAAWVDVFQGGRAMVTRDVSGAISCEGVRKSVKFELAAKPFTIELSSAKSNSLGIAITPD